VGAASLTTAHAAGEGAPEKDPKQWSTPDTTPQARYETAKKEAGAAYQEALKECASLRGAEKSSCVKDAQASFKSDLDAAKQELSSK
jgi:hypothetical protein